MKQKTKKWLKIIGNILLLALFIQLADNITTGLLYYIGFLFVFIARRLWQRREDLVFILRMAESSIFGKPLDRDEWKKGEMKNTKIKLTWGKNDGRKTKQRT